MQLCSVGNVFVNERKPLLLLITTIVLVLPQDSNYKRDNKIFQRTIFIVFNYFALYKISCNIFAIFVTNKSRTWLSTFLVLCEIYWGFGSRRQGYGCLFLNWFCLWVKLQLNSKCGTVIWLTLSVAVVRPFVVVSILANRLPSARLYFVLFAI